MATGSFSVEIKNLKVTKDNFKKVEKRLQNMRHILDVIGQYMVTESQENILRQREYTGKKWKQSKAAQKRGGKTLFDHGHLFQSINHKLQSKYSVKFGANVGAVGTVIYAAIHQYGGKTGRNHAVRLPPRYYIGINKTNQQEITRQIYKWLLQT